MNNITIDTAALTASIMEALTPVIAQTVTAHVQAAVGQIAAPVDLAAPAVTAAPVEAPAVTTKPLTKQAWQTLRRTKGGMVRKAFAGLTREQAFEAGLCEGFHMPTGERKAAIRAYNAAK